MDYHKVSIIIPNWNGKKFLKTCLDSLRKQTFKDFEVILVDNGSTDGSVQYLKGNYPDVRIVELPENKGFSVAVNEGIKASKGELIALLNNDTEADPNWLKELHKALLKSPKVGFCASKMLSYNRRDIFDAAGDLLTSGGGPARIGKEQKDVGQFNEPRKVFGACAGAAIYRKSLFDDIGLFDEDFFAYYEDVDLSFRAQLKGYECLYVPSAVVYHKGSGTLGVMSDIGIYYSNKNRMHVLVKNIPTLLIFKYLFKILWTQFKYNMFYVIRKKAKPALKGGIDGLLQLKAMINKRKGIQRTRKVSNEYIDSLLKEGDRLRKEAKIYRRNVIL